MREKEFPTGPGRWGASGSPHERQGSPWEAGAGRALHMPGRITVQVDVPPLGSWAYGACYGGLAASSLLTRHRLQVRLPPVFEARFDPGDHDGLRWCMALGLDEEATTAPFLYAQAVGTVLYLRVFASLGLNSRHLLHLDHASWMGVAAQGPQTVGCELVDVVALGGGRVVLSVASDVRDTAGRSTLKVRDRFLVRGYGEAQLAHLPLDAELGRAIRLQALRQPRLDPEQAQVLQVPIARDAGWRYARVSGDASLMHISSLGARLFGFPRAVLQGMATRNLVLGHLASIGVSIRQVELQLCRPVFCGQMARLVREGPQVELLDRHGQLLAAGLIGMAAA